MEQLLDEHMVGRHFEAAFCFGPHAQGHILQTGHAHPTPALTQVCLSCLIRCRQQETCETCSGCEGTVTAAARTAHFRIAFCISQSNSSFCYFIMIFNNTRLSLTENQASFQL